MKTIEVSDEMYAKLIELATEMTTQDPRGTRMPHLFQIQTDKKVYDWDLNGDTPIWIDSDAQYEIETFEELKDYLVGREIEIPENLQDMWDDLDDDNLIEFFEKNEVDLKKCSYSIEHEYKNGFFTAKACENHIKLNGYHYSNPKCYLSHAWRNPEMELVSEFLCGLVGKKMHT